MSALENSRVAFARKAHEDNAARAFATLDDVCRDRESTALVLDGAIANGLARALGVNALKRAGVGKLYALEPEGEIPPSDESDGVAFMCRPQLDVMKTVAEHVKKMRDNHERALRARAEAVAKASRASASLLKRVASSALRRSEDVVEDTILEVKPLPKMTVICVPRVTEMCRDALRDLHAFDYVTMVGCDVNLIPFEPDLFTLEYPEVYAEVMTENYEQCVYYVASALHKLQRDVTGLAHVVKGKGNIAHKCAQMMLDMRKGGQVDEPEHVEPGVDGDSLVDMIVLLDRDVDMVTPLCTQLTYEGLIDEILGVEKGAVAIPQRAFGGDVKDEEEDKNREVYVRARAHKSGKIAMRPKLNNTDPLFDEIRSMNFGRACNVIRDKSTAIKEDYEAIKGGNVEDQHVSEIGGFVKKIKANIGGTGLDLHATLAKYLIDCTKKIWFQNRLECERLCVEGQDLNRVMDHIEVMIYRGDEAIPCLRMICLACICFGGFPTKIYEKIFTDLFNAFGGEICLKLYALETAGLFLEKDQAKLRPRGFAAARKALKLVADNVDGSEAPKDITFAYSSSGYAPLSCRLIEGATRGPWRAIAPNNTGEEVLKSLPGELFEYTQTVDDYGFAINAKASYKEFDKRRNKSAPLDGRDELWPKPTVLVFFIGGVTHAEIACLRHLATTKHCGCNFVIATTKVFQGDALIDTCGEDLKRLKLRTREI